MDTVTQQLQCPTLDGAREAKRTLEKELGALLNGFMEATGLSIECVNLEVFDECRFGMRPVRHVTEVNVKVRL